MSQVFTVTLRRHDEVTGVVLFQARAKDFNSVVLLMRVQGIVPVYDILSYTERPAFQFIKGLIFPRSVPADESDADHKHTSIFMPIVCWIKRNHLLVTYGAYGKFCTRCKGVFPNV